MLPCQKHLFQLDPTQHYLNGAYMAPLLRTVETAGIQAIRRRRQPTDIAPADFFTDVEQLRGLFAQLIGAPDAAEGVALVSSVSYGMGIALKNLPLRSGQNIVLAQEQFPSNVYPCMSAAAQVGASIRTVNLPAAAHQRGKEWNAALLEAIDEDTALVVLEPLHWANGLRFELRTVAEKVHRVGGLLVVDGTQAVGAYPLDVQQEGVDVLVCACYKWLMGPYGLGLAWFSPALRQGRPLEEGWINRRGSEDFARLVEYQQDYQPGARRYDVGERSNFTLVPMAIAALEQVLDWQPQRVQGYCQALLSEAIPQWQAHGYGVAQPDERATHLLGVELPARLSPERVQQRLRERRVSVSVRGGFVRIAPHVYNDQLDVDALTDALLSL